MLLATLTLFPVDRNAIYIFPCKSTFVSPSSFLSFLFFSPLSLLFSSPPSALCSTKHISKRHPRIPARMKYATVYIRLIVCRQLRFVKFQRIRREFKRANFYFLVRSGRSGLFRGLLPRKFAPLGAPWKIILLPLPLELILYTQGLFNSAESPGPSEKNLVYSRDKLVYAARRPLPANVTGASGCGVNPADKNVGALHQGPDNREKRAGQPRSFKLSSSLSLSSPRTPLRSFIFFTRFFSLLSPFFSFSFFFFFPPCPSPRSFVARWEFLRLFHPSLRDRVP